VITGHSKEVEVITDQTSEVVVVVDQITEVAMEDQGQDMVKTDQDKVIKQSVQAVEKKQ
jgi:hypothetical protein